MSDKASRWDEHETLLTADLQHPHREKLLLMILRRSTTVLGGARSGAATGHPESRRAETFGAPAVQTAYLRAADLTAVTLKAQTAIRFIQPERGALHKYTPLSHDANFCCLLFNSPPCLQAGSDEDSPIPSQRPAVPYLQEYSHRNP